MEEELVDTAFIHIDNLDLKAPQGDDLAFLGEAPQPVQDKTGHRMEAGANFEILANGVTQFDQISAAIDQK